MVQWIVILLTLLIGVPAHGLEVMRFTRTQKYVLVKGPEAWDMEHGQPLCLQRFGTTIACGSVTRTKDDKAIIAVNDLRARILVRDELTVEETRQAEDYRKVGDKNGFGRDDEYRRERRLLSSLRSRSMSPDERSSYSLNVGLGATGGLGYALPSLRLQLPLSRHFNLGITGSLMCERDARTMLGSWLHLAVNFNEQSFNGLWIESAVGGLYFKSADESGASPTAYIAAGWGWVFGSRISLQGGVGVQYIPQIKLQTLEVVLPVIQPIFMGNIGFLF